jgi:hypothetical protein
MTEENIFEEADSLDSLKSQLHELVIALAARVEERLQDLDKAIEKLEQQIATLILGFGEQAVNMEGLLAQVKFSTPDAQKEFMDTIAHSRKKMLETMKEGASGLLASESPGIASAIESMVDEKLSD